MKNKIHSISQLGTYIFLILTLSSVFGVCSEKYKDFLQLNDQELSQKIKVFETCLKTDGDNATLLKLLGIAYHHLAREDKKQYALKAFDTLTEGHNLDKQDNTTLCYLGSATTMMAETTWNQMEKMSFVNKGVGYMDKAVRRDPDVIRIRFTRAYNSLALPDFLNRRSIATTDFEHLANLIELHPEKYSSLKQEVFNNLIKIYNENGSTDKANLYSKKLKNQ